MGIVVTVFMTLILFLSVSGPVERRLKQFQSSIFLIAFIIGIWNVFWYGTQHIDDYWGIAAVLSGISMILTSIVGLPIKRAPVFIKCPICWIQAKLKAMPQGFHELTLLVLVGCIGIYGYTLIEINLP